MKKPAFWLNRERITSPLHGMQTYGFLLSERTPESLVEFMQSSIIYDTVNGRDYRRDTFGDYATDSDGHSVSATNERLARFTLSSEGRLRIEWSATAEHVVYPRKESGGTGGPIRSFAVWITDSANRFFGDRLKSYPNSRIREDYRQPKLWVVGSVGEKGSGADLELEGASTWQLGEPLYVPDNELTFPLELVHGMTGQLEPAPNDYTPMEKTGDLRNIALLGTNGLTQDSYRIVMSGSRNSGNAAWMAFNGHIGSSPPYNEAAYGIAEGQWYMNARDLPVGVEVDFGKVVTGIDGYVIRKRFGSSSGSPKNLTIEVSLDGENFTVVESVTRPSEAECFIRFLDAPVAARYLRVIVHKTWRFSLTDALYLGDIEILQAGSWAD